MGRNDALYLLDAINGPNSPLRLDAVVKFGVAESGERIRFSTDLGQVYTFLDRVAGPDRVFYGVDLQNYLGLMIEQGIVSSGYTSQVDTSSADKAKATLPTFLRAAQSLFTPIDGGDAYRDLGPQYRLKHMQIGNMTVRFETEAFGGQALKSLDFQSPLHQVLGPALRGQNLDAYVHLVVVGGGGRGPTELPRRVRSPELRPRSRPGAISLAAIGNSAVPLSLAIRPTSNTNRIDNKITMALLSQHALLANLEYAHIDLAGNAPRRLPVVTDQQFGLWQDRVDGNGHLWHAPRFALVSPTPTTPPESSPFLFTYRVSGHDAQGRPGLEGAIKVTLRRERPAEVQAQMDAQNLRDVFPVALTNINVGLEIPFRDQSGATKRNLIAASTIEDDGQTVVATINVLDDWVRLSYGALAFQDFQPGEQARLVVQYSFEAYREVKRGSASPELILAFGGKSVGVPVTQGAKEANPAAGLLQVDGRSGQVTFGTNKLGAPEKPAPKPSRCKHDVRPLASMAWPGRRITSS